MTEPVKRPRGRPPKVAPPNKEVEFEALVSVFTDTGRVKAGEKGKVNVETARVWQDAGAIKIVI